MSCAQECHCDVVCAWAPSKMNPLLVRKRRAPRFQVYGVGVEGCAQFPDVRLRGGVLRSVPRSVRGVLAVFSFNDKSPSSNYLLWRHGFPSAVLIKSQTACCIILRCEPCHKVAACNLKNSEMTTI